MDIQLRHAPSSTVARCVLAPGEAINVEGGSMLACSAQMHVEASTPGGFLGGLKRAALSEGSYFVTTYTAPPQGGWVDVAGRLPGDTIALPIMPGQDFYLSQGSWLANSRGVSVDSQWGGMKNVFGGQGGFGFKASGDGHALIAVYGAIDTFDLAAGESITIDSGHVVAYHLAMQFELRRAVRGKTMQSLKSGEGWVFDFTGPGRVLTQTRNPRELERLIVEKSASN
ncbi:MAG: TIGR00266 family protein [Rhodococcus sp. (in: high G+C Gram-positive bacteria)]|jgi:uncharacterized protein (TIGR00266 family)|uniref:TIGR00266 family protein n=1 Tax=Rhodococcus sp. EPR-157 TaxID=1813677 RepID=UPI0007BBE7C0|nr:TIGR00266 family protein [Rhodococcus sp. EPR-157]KZE99453.1 TIGR00266 family protein [Rhodococcus sp. EPR-157]